LPSHEKFKAVQGMGVSEHEWSLIATQGIRKGEVITGFGDSSVVLGVNVSHRFGTILRNSNSQYTVEAEMLQLLPSDPIGKIWIVPEQDRKRLQQCKLPETIATELEVRSLITGQGQLAQHCCCPRHRNMKLELVQIKGNLTPGRWGVACRAARDIDPGEQLCVTYWRGPKGQKNETTWREIFDCECCLCKGECRNSSLLTHKSFLENILTATAIPLKLQRPEIWNTAKGRRVVLNDGSRGTITGRVVKAFVPVWVHSTDGQPKQLSVTMHNSSDLHITAEVDEWITWAGMRGRITKSALLALEDEYSGSILADEVVDKML
jgi:hypothetical protein